MLFLIWFDLNNFTPLEAVRHNIWSKTRSKGWEKDIIIMGVTSFTTSTSKPHNSHRWLCMLSPTDTDSMCVSNCRQLTTQVSACTPPPPAHEMLTHAPFNQIIFSRTAGQSQAYYDMLKMGVGVFWRHPICTIQQACTHGLQPFDPLSCCAFHDYHFTPPTLTTLPFWSLILMNHFFL